MILATFYSMTVLSNLRMAVKSNRITTYGYNGHIRYFCTKNENKETLLESFFQKFYDTLQSNKELNIYDDDSKSNVSHYQDEVIRLLQENDPNSLSEEELVKLQTRIEDLTMKYDDIKNIFQLAPDLVKILVNPNKPSAKEYLKNSMKFSSNDLDIINNLNQYSLEVIIIYTLASLFNCVQTNKPAVRVSTLIEKLDTISRTQANLLKARFKPLTAERYRSTNPKEIEEQTSKKKVKINEIEEQTSKKKVKKNETLVSKPYIIGALLVEFLLSREMITLSNELDFTHIYESKRKSGKYFIPKKLYAICNFNIDLLPIRLNLPMICRPRDWEVIPQLKAKKEDPRTVSDLTGGYLSGPIGDFYFIERYNLISSHNLDNFYIILEDGYKQLIMAMNFLQSQAFEINTDVLDFINKYFDKFVNYGLFMPKFLASLNVAKTTDLLRKSYIDDIDISKKYKYQDVLNEFLSRVQRARYEGFIFKIASAYVGYKFYLPAFLDFRGRIYRSGVLHFHERDLARSLIVFSNVKETSYDYNLLYSAAGFHYKKYSSYQNAASCIIDFCNHIKSIDLCEDILENISKEMYILSNAREPFQFLSKIIAILAGKKISPLQIPITQDASASAYQLISYFLLDKDLAMKTNLIPYINIYGEILISDIYNHFLEEVKNHLMEKLEPKLSEIVCSRLNRKLIKSIFMPLVYGKTPYSISSDIFKHYSTLINKLEALTITSSIIGYFNNKYDNILNLIFLIRDIGWLSASKNQPIFYSTTFYTTVQDYMKSKATTIWIYDRIHKKRRQVTLRIPTSERDRRKTSAAIFANFIHQKDAILAIHMILYMKYMDAPFYTVHDNFITNLTYAKLLPNRYIEFFSKVTPIDYINYYIVRNLKGGKKTIMDSEAPFYLHYFEDMLIKNIVNWSYF